MIKDSNPWPSDHTWSLLGETCVLGFKLETTRIAFLFYNSQLEIWSLFYRISFDNKISTVPVHFCPSHCWWAWPSRRRPLACGVALQYREYRDEDKVGVVAEDQPFQQLAKTTGDMRSGSACCHKEQCPGGPNTSNQASGWWSLLSRLGTFACKKVIVLLYTKVSQPIQKWFSVFQAVLTVNGAYQIYGQSGW